MSYSRCSGNFSSRSLGGALRCPGSACGSSCPSNLVYSPGLCSPGPCPLGSSLHSGCQETCWEPTRCQPSCHRPRTSTLGRPCHSADTMSPGCGSSRGCSLGSGGFRPLGYGVCGFPSLGSGSGFCRPYFPSRSLPSSCYQPFCRSGFY